MGAIVTCIIGHERIGLLTHCDPNDIGTRVEVTYTLCNPALYWVPNVHPPPPVAVELARL